MPCFVIKKDFKNRTLTYHRKPKSKISQFKQQQVQQMIQYELLVAKHKWRMHAIKQSRKAKLHRQLQQSRHQYDDQNNWYMMSGTWYFWDPATGIWWEQFPGYDHRLFRKVWVEYDMPFSRWHKSQGHRSHHMDTDQTRAGNILSSDEDIINAMESVSIQ
jgi:hypothetical protein